jgi:hypothetical protein
MLDSAVKFLADEVNQYLRRRSSVVQVVPGGLADEAGKWAVDEGAIGLAIVNVEEERTLRSQVPERVFRNGSHILRPPELKLNLQIVFAVRPKTSQSPTPNPYVQSLQYLSFVLTYFQSHPVFTPDEYPALDAGIEKLAIELLSYGPEQLNQMWAYIGTKYLPSVVYRVRIAMQQLEPEGIGQPITTLESVLHRK